jgi:hypothetical protein
VIGGLFVQSNPNYDYKVQRDTLIAALETEGPGVLVLPTSLTRQGDLDSGRFMADTYSVSEHREKGGWAEFEMTFVEYGALIAPLPATQPQVQSLSQLMGEASSDSLNQTLQDWYQGVIIQ